MSKFIIPECWADTVVIEVIGFKKPNKADNIGEVINKLNNHYVNRVGIGFIDKDKARKGAAENKIYQEIKRFNEHLILKRKPDSNHYLIQHTNLESWLYTMATDLGLDMDRYLVNDLLTNTKKYKTQSISYDINFRNFINALYQKNESPLRPVKIWIDELLP